MIIKRNMKTGIPKNKRCKPENFESSVNKKKRKENGFYSAEGVSGSSEVKSNSNSVDSNGIIGNSAAQSEEGIRPRSDRAQKLPCRFNDSILYNNFGIEDENKRVSLCLPYAAELSDSGYSVKTFKTTVKGSRSLWVREKSKNACGFSSDVEGVDDNGKRKKGVYRLEDFALGDLVWAKCGKSYPVWPAVVIDPILQAPESVLSRCVPAAICVMFFGYSKNGKQRVNLLLVYVNKFEFLIH